KDLFKLGYWITDGLKVPGIGKAMVYDGCFGKGTYSGLKTFQYEHKDEYGLKVTGELDSKSAELIKKLIKKADFKRPGIPVEASSIPDGLFCVYANKKPSKPQRLFQLPPSPDHLYKRYGDVMSSTGGELGDVYHNDAWGTKEMIESLVELSKDWKENGDILEIGDISAWNCAAIGHASHRDGHSVDIRSSKVGAMVKHDSPNHLYDKEKTVEFAKKAIDKGFKYVITLCPHVTRECNFLARKEELNYVYINQIENHHNHLHMDYWISGSRVENPNIKKSFCKNCPQRGTCDSRYKYDEKRIIYDNKYLKYQAT
ncbi:MAG: hypothetical protein GXY77_00970, partial [Fibrobacter sp.]|nr:hypothetical protein [Fibrobacter sp.]